MTLRVCAHVQREAVRRWPSRRWGVIWQAAAAHTPTKDSHLARVARSDGPTTQRVGASELDPWKKLRVDESRPMWHFETKSVGGQNDRLF
jgi:hypothetical protein